MVELEVLEEGWRQEELRNSGRTGETALPSQAASELQCLADVPPAEKVHMVKHVVQRLSHHWLSGRGWMGHHRVQVLFSVHRHRKSLTGPTVPPRSNVHGLARILHEFRWVLLDYLMISMECKHNSELYGNTIVPLPVCRLILRHISVDPA